MYTDLDSLYISLGGLRFIESDHTLFGYKSPAGLEIGAHYWFRKLTDIMVASFELNVENCNQLANLSECIGKLASLQTLKLFGCSKLKKFPDELGSLQCLEELNADETTIEEVPPSITFFSKLEVLSFAGCKGGVSMSWNLVVFLVIITKKTLATTFFVGFTLLENFEFK